MPILNYTTKIDPHKTIGEITKTLVDHGASKIAIDYNDKKMPSALTFQLDFDGRPMFYKLPARFEGVLNALIAQKVPGNLRNLDQSNRVAWRIIKDWVEAQMALVEAQQAEVQEIFLPYLMLQDGNTMYDRLKGNNGLMNLLNK